MKALSIRQPWAWAILHAGKDIENRHWQPRNPGLRFRGTALLHASKGMTRAEYEDALRFMHGLSRQMPFPPGLTLPAFDDLTRGAIAGVVEIFDVVTSSESPWFFGPIGLRLRNTRAFACPIPFKGALGFFDVPDGLVADAMAEGGVA